MYDTLIQEYGGHFGKGRTVDDIVNCVEDVPPMPDVCAQALRLVDDLDATPEDLAAVLLRDPALTSPILRAANSASLGQQREVTTLATAVLVVGMGHVKALLLASAMRGWNKNFGPVERLAWEKSLGAATCARLLCECLKKPYKDELYLNGLLHNLGQIVLLAVKDIGTAYPGVLQRIGESHEDFATAEREVIGFSHPLVGALVARKWGFPLATCQMILHYDDPFEGISGKEDEKLAVLKLATQLGLTADLGRPEGYDLYPETLSQLAQALGFDGVALPTNLQDLIGEIRSRFAIESATFA